MKRGSWVLLTLLSLLLGCSSASTGADTRRYACAQDDECAAGFACRAGVCQLGESLAGFEFSSATELRVRRASSLGRARWTAYVVEFNPP